MDLAELSRELEKRSTLAAGTFSRVVVRTDVGPRTEHYEITGIAVLGDTIILIANEEAEAPYDPAEQEAGAIDRAGDRLIDFDDPGINEADEEMERSERMELDSSHHLRTAEDQPAQELLESFDPMRDPLKDAP